MMNSRNKGLVSLVIMAVLTLALILGSESIYNLLGRAGSGSSDAGAVAERIETSAAGFGGDVLVATEISEEGSIINVEIVDCSAETDTIGQTAAPQVAAAIVEAQSTDVDGVSGATITSDAVKAAVEAALAQAGGETAPAGEATEAVEGTTEAAEEVTKAEKEATEATTEAAEEATEAAADETEAAEEATEAAEAAEASTAAGVYDGSAKGYGGDVQVQVIVGEDGSLQAVKILDMSMETDTIGQAAAPQVAAAILKAQSTDVDSVSGATVTSDAVKAAVDAALAQTGGAAAPAEDAEEATEAAEEATEAAEETEASAEETTEAAVAPAVTAGEYEATVQGYGGEIKVSVVLDEENVIRAVKLLDISTEDAEVGQVAAREMAAAIVKANSLDVDTVSGATVTSDAVILAALEAIEQATAQ